MKLLQLTSYLLLNAFLVLAKKSIEQVPFQSSSNETKPPTINFDVNYNLLEHLNADLSSGVEFSMEEFATFNYSFTNNEKMNVSVVGVGGTVVSNPEGYQVANITEQSIGPILIGVNDTANFQASIKLVLPEGEFYMLPVLNVLKDEEPLRIGIRPLLITVTPPPMSFLNPSFLSVQLLLCILIAGATYAFVTFNRSERKQKFVKGRSPVTVDESWLPDTYKNSEKRKSY